MDIETVRTSIERKKDAIETKLSEIRHDDNWKKYKDQFKDLEEELPESFVEKTTEQKLKEIYIIIQIIEFDNCIGANGLKVHFNNIIKKIIDLLWDMIKMVQENGFPYWEIQNDNELVQFTIDRNDENEKIKYVLKETIKYRFKDRYIELIKLKLEIEKMIKEKEYIELCHFTDSKVDSLKLKN